jgi:catechol 2,3-dioxygenase-like lactoylglutathione lyase family enzyme
MKLLTTAIAAALLLPAAAHAGPPAAIAPNVVSGWGWDVANLEASRAWYEDKLGMKVIRSYQREGKVYEYILQFEGAPEAGAILALLASPTRKPGPSTAGRVILRVADSKALSEWLAGQGVPSRMVAPGAYFFTDNEGNPIEIYTPPKP